MSEKLKLNWKRPATTEYPKVWHTFKARDLDSDELVEYRIQDLPLDRVDEIIECMCENYIPDEPIGQVLGSGKSPEHVEDYKLLWSGFIDQKMPIVCFKEGTDEIVGSNMIFVLQKGDPYMDEAYKQFKNQITRDIFRLEFICYENFDPFKFYCVDAILISFGLTVNRKYRRRSIGDQLLNARRFLCKEFGLKLTHTFFTSDFSIHNADKVGFKTDVAINYEDVIKAKPEFSHIKGIKSKQMTLKTLIV